MRTLRNSLSLLAIGAVTVFMPGCASVPDEVVELSYLVGQDLEEMHRSYEDLITDRFDDFRERRIEYLETVWIPAFLEDWVESGRLIDTAKGEVVWSEDENEFVPPTPGREERQRLDTIRQWSNAAIAEIEEKRKELIAPLDERESEILDDVRRSFEKIRHANAHVTAHLNSIRKVQEVQSRALERFGAKDEIEKLDETIEELSQWAADGLSEIRAKDRQLERAVEDLEID